MYRVVESYPTERDEFWTVFADEVEAQAYAQRVASEAGGLARRNDLGNGSTYYDATPCRNSRCSCRQSWVRVEPVRPDESVVPGQWYRGERDSNALISFNEPSGSDAIAPVVEIRVVK